MIAPHPLPARGAATAPDHRLRALAVCGALLTTGLLWLASQALGVTLLIDLHDGQPPQLFGPVFLLSFTLLFSLAGWGTLAILEHVTRWALPLWTGLGVVVLVASLEPISSIGASGSAKAVLASIHLTCRHRADHGDASERGSRPQGGHSNIRRAHAGSSAERAGRMALGATSSAPAHRLVRLAVDSVCGRSYG